MYEFVVDRDSGQWKAPFNEICQRGAGLHLQGHRRRHAEQRHAVLDALARPARRADGALGPGGPEDPLLLGAALRRQHLQLRVHRHPRDRHRGGRLPGGGPGWKGEKPPGIKEVFRSSTQFSLAIFRTQLFDPKDMENVKKVQAGYQAQPLSAYLKQPRPSGGPGDRLPEVRQGAREDRLLRVPRLRPPVRAARARGGGHPRAGWPASASAPGKTFDFKDLSLEHKAAVALGMKEGERKVEEQVASLRQGRQRLEGRLGLRRPRLLPRRLAAARGARPRRASTATTPWRPCTR